MKEKLAAAKEPSETVLEILDVAEEFVRTGGYHTASYRDIAERVGIKAASVHYHFPTKEDLGAAVMRRYAGKAVAFLGDPTDVSVSPRELLLRHVSLFRAALVNTQRVCLGAQLLSESAGVPSVVREATREFVEVQIGWLRTVLLRQWPGETEKATATAWVMMCTMQGALSASLAVGGAEAFERVAKRIEALWE